MRINSNNMSNNSLNNIQLSDGLFHYTLNSGDLIFQPRQSVSPTEFEKTAQLWERSLKEGGTDELLHYPDIQFNVRSDINDTVASTLLSVYIDDLKLPIIQSYVGIRGTSAYTRARLLSSSWQIPHNPIINLQAPYLIDILNPVSYFLYTALLIEKGLFNNSAGWSGDYCNCMGQVMMTALQKRNNPTSK